MVGLVGYFRCSIPNFSQNAYPLYQLLKRNHSTHKQGKEQIEEQEIHQEALDQFLQHLVTPPILTNPDMETFHITHRCIRAKIRLCCFKSTMRSSDSSVLVVTHELVLS